MAGPGSIWRRICPDHVRFASDVRGGAAAAKVPVLVIIALDGAAPARARRASPPLARNGVELLGRG